MWHIVVVAFSEQPQIVSLIPSRIRSKEVTTRTLPLFYTDNFSNLENVLLPRFQEYDYVVVFGVKMLVWSKFSEKDSKIL